MGSCPFYYVLIFDDKDSFYALSAECETKQDLEEYLEEELENMNQVKFMRRWPKPSDFNKDVKEIVLVIQGKIMSPTVKQSFEVSA